MAEEEKEAEYEQRLLKIEESFLYKVPPLKEAVGHRAESWGLGTPMLTAKLELVGLGEVLEIRISDAEKNERVARCPVRCGKGAAPIEAVVDAAVDSSRYFVLRCEDDKKRHAYVGVGFRERETAFNFKATILDFKAKIDRQRKADESRERRELHLQQPDLTPDQPALDLQLKGPIKITLAGGRHRPTSRPCSTAVSSETTKPVRLAPPPSHISPPKPPQENDDDDFGDFESAPPV